MPLSNPLYPETWSEHNFGLLWIKHYDRRGCAIPLLPHQHTANEERAAVWTLSSVDDSLSSALQYMGQPVVLELLMPYSAW